MQTDSNLPQSAVSVRAVVKAFGNQKALNGIDLDVSQGESMVIFGPNGAGKSTLIRILATMARPSSGQVLINGLDIKDHAEQVRRNIGVITHQTFLYGDLTAYENLEFYSRMYDVPSYRERINEVIRMVGMADRFHDRVRTFSRGMQQRLTIARSLLHRPPIMLLDEPETGLDQEAISTLWDILKSFEASQRTVILTTHNLELGLTICDRLLIMNKGRLAYQCRGDTLDLAGLRQAYREHTGATA